MNLRGYRSCIETWTGTFSFVMRVNHNHRVKLVEHFTIILLLTEFLKMYRCPPNMLVNKRIYDSRTRQLATITVDDGTKQTWNNPYTNGWQVRVRKVKYVPGVKLNCAIADWPQTNWICATIRMGSWDVDEEYPILSCFPKSSLLTLTKKSEQK